MRNAILMVACLACVFTTFPAVSEDAQTIIRMGTKPQELMTAKITVANLRRSFDFYTKAVGLKEIAWPGLPKPNIDDADAASIEVCLNFTGSSADPFVCLLKQKGAIMTREQAKLIWVSFKIPDARATLNRVRAAGFTVEGDVIEVMGLVMSLVNDPDGYTVQLLEARSIKR